MLLQLSLLALLTPQDPPDTSVVINEFLYDDEGPDQSEFVELYNRSTQQVDISGWSIETSDSLGVDAVYVIPPLTVLEPREIYTLGANAANPGRIDFVIGTTNLFEDGNDAITLYDRNGRLIDTVMYETVIGVFDPALAEGPGIRARFTALDRSPLSWQRVYDGFDTGNNGRDFCLQPMTPGDPNFAKVQVPSVDGFEQAAIGAAVRDFVGSFEPPRVIAPGVVGPSVAGWPLNPSVMPASPAGGNAAVFWDPSGNGNSVYYPTRPHSDVVISALVYFDSTRAPATQGETWNIGARGTVGQFAHHTDPTGRFTALTHQGWFPGNTGVAACFQRTESYARLFLVDYGDGSWLRVLGSIDIDSNNDGWQPLVLRVIDDRAEFDFGAATVSGTVSSTTPGGLYFSYRHHFFDPSVARPLTLDNLRILDSAAATTELGSATAHNFGTPKIFPIGVPAIGNAAFEIGARNLVANNSSTFMLIGFELKPSLSLALFGGIPGSALYVDTLANISLRTDPLGRTSMPLPIPSVTRLIGSVFVAQVFDLDNTFPARLPLGNTAGLRINVGR